MTEQGWIIEAQGLRRVYRKTVALDGLSLQVAPGELFGIVGPDGAGKTTALRLLAGLLRPSGGWARVAGFDIDRQAEKVKPLIGYMAQQFSLYRELTVLENLEFFADLFSVHGALRQERMERLLAFARLEPFRQRRAAHLSGGMQKKLALACTLIHQPRILLLDEPTTGVDPISRREFWDILGELHGQGTTILVSTPYMDEAERCTRVALMFAGRLLVCDRPAAIRRMVKGEIIELLPADWRRAKETLRQLPQVHAVQTYGERLRVFVDSYRRDWPLVRRELERRKLVLHSARRSAVRLEDAFLSLVESAGGADEP